MEDPAYISPDTPRPPATIKAPVVIEKEGIVDVTTNIFETVAFVRVDDPIVELVA